MSAALLSNTLAGRFGWLFEGLCKVIGADAYKRGMEAALAWAVWNRVRVLGERFMALAARAQAGRLPAARTARRDTSPEPSPQSGEGEVCDAEKPQAVRGPTAGLPREFGWVTTVLPRTAQFAGVLAWLLRDPETAALVDMAPEAGRILRPLCHLLGVETPEFLRRGYVPASPLPDLPSPPQNDGDAVVASEPAVTTETPIATEVTAPPAPPPVPVTVQPPAPPPRPRPGGLVWNGRGLEWA